jgi:lipoprotein-releasing system permease protein
MVDSIKDIKHIVAINPIIESQAMFSASGKAIGGIVKAIKFDDIKNKKDIFNSIADTDTLEDFDDSSYIFVGKNLATNLELVEGDEIKIISPDMKNTIFGVIPKVKTYTVGGIFKSGMQEYDSMTVFIPFKMGQLQFGYENSANSIEIYLDNSNISSDIYYEIRNKLIFQDYDFYIVDWKEVNSSLIEALAVERNVMFLILTLIIIIATFNIISSLTMLVMDKKKQIALLKTIGMTNNSIMNIFFICGTIIGFLGTAVGVVIGLAFSNNINEIKLFFDRIFNVNLFNPEVYYLTELPSKIILSDVLLIVSVTLFLSFLSTIYPARKAAKINPAEILRYE